MDHEGLAFKAGHGAPGKSIQEDFANAAKTSGRPSDEQIPTQAGHLDWHDSWRSPTIWTDWFAWALPRITGNWRNWGASSLPGSRKSQSC